MREVQRMLREAQMMLREAQRMLPSANDGRVEDVGTG